MALYEFTQLKSRVERIFNIRILDERLMEFQFDEKIDVSLEDIKLEKCGIFHINPNGQKIKGYLAITKFNIGYYESQGWKIPSFHTTNCEKIQEQIVKNKFHGRYTLKRERNVIFHTDGSIEDMIICNYCRKAERIPTFLTTEKYCNEILSDPNREGNFYLNEIPVDIGLDENGKTKDWPEKSRAFRESKNYTCEVCRIRPNEHKFIEAHHIGSPSINTRNNLKCLCKLCHTFVDSKHSSIARNSNESRKRLIEFVNKYRGVLEINKNPHLDDYNRIF